MGNDSPTPEKDPYKHFEVQDSEDEILVVKPCG